MSQDKSGNLRIGNYILGETLGVGSFGKVKSMYISSPFHTLLEDANVMR
jgi:hypothetical protein